MVYFLRRGRNMVIDIDGKFLGMYFGSMLWDLVMVGRGFLFWDYIVILI